jgi:integrase
VTQFRRPKVALFSRDYQRVPRDEHVFVFYATAVYTGLRAGELAALLWPEVTKSVARPATA